MKKTFLILFFTFSFLFLIMPKDTFAMDIEIKPSGSFNTMRIGNNDFYYFQYGASTSGIDYSYVFGPDHAFSNMNYSFLIYMGSYSSQQNLYKPIVQLNHATCDVVQNNSLYTGSSTYFSNVYAVKCNNVRLDKTNVKVNIVQPNVSASINNIFGISSIWDFTPVYNSNSIISSIQSNTDETKKTNEKLDDLNDNITDSDTSDSQSSAGSFFEDFKSDDYGLSDIITMPLTFIKGLSNASCYSLVLPLPFVDHNATIPCMTSIYENYFGSFLTLYQTITTGFIAYWVCVNIYRLVKNFKNPDDDKVEVMEL